MTLELTPEQESILLEIAHHDGKSAAEVLIETALSLRGLADDRHEQRILDERIADADRAGDWLSHEEVGKRLHTMLHRG